ncbi:hypothetical protein NBE98_00830 [Clostridium swellfunianum]|nr:hypothetical protein [Clostridium swellfunianum]
MKKHLITEGTNTANIREDKAINNIEKLINNALLGIDKSNVDYISICVPGLKKYSSQITLLKEFQTKFSIMGDELNAFYGALGNDRGIVILSGTGSFAIGRNSIGKMHTVGGWGAISQDEGSGYYMGVQALKAVMRNYDSMGRDTILSNLILEAFNIKSINDLKSFLYNGSCGVKEIAALSKLVKYGAENHDFVCKDIANDCAYKLFQLAEGVINRLEMYDEKYNLCLTGGISNFKGLILNPLNELLENKYLNIHIKEPEFTPVVGSIILCFIQTGRSNLDKNIEGIKKSLKDVKISVI